MGKRNDMKDKGDVAKIIYKKKSNTSLYTYSRSCSVASQLTKSGILQIKKNLSHNMAYNEGDTFKKDFSIETDICVLRRYFKQKRRSIKMNSQTASAKSRNSNYTEIDPIEEFDHDDSACGDSDHSTKHPYYNTDVTTLMIDNFKTLLNGWIKKHLVEDKCTKKKLETALDTIISKIESNKTETMSSFSTRGKNRDNQRLEIKNKQIGTSSINRQFFEKSLNTSSIECDDHSYYSTPIPLRKLKIISTLSLPRNFCQRNSISKRKKDKSRKDKKDKNVLVSLYEPNSIFADHSNFNLLSISTKSLMRRCTRYKARHAKDNVQTKEVTKRLMVLPEPSFKNVSVSTACPKLQAKLINSKKNNLKKQASQKHPDKLHYNIANKTDDKSDKIGVGVIETSTLISNASISSVHIHHESEYTYCNACFESSQAYKDTLQSKSIVKIDFLNEQVKPSNKSVPKTCNDLKVNNDKSSIRTRRTKRKLLDRRIKKPRKSAIIKQPSCIPKFETIQYKDFTYLHKKVKNHNYESNDFLNHFKDIFKYFANYEGKRNITLDVHVNVFPIFEKGTGESSTNAGKNLSPREIKTSPTIVYNVEPRGTLVNSPMEIGDGSVKESTTYSFGCQPEIIPLLDGAASQAKYLCSRQNSYLKYGHFKKLYNMTDRSTMTFDLEIAKEIFELKTAIKDLSATAERLAKEHFSHKKMKVNESKVRVNAKTSPKISTKMKSTQYSKSLNKINKKPKRLNASHGIQISSRFRKNLDSGFKIKMRKGVNKNESSASGKLPLRESTSYRVIESETLLKVTDMTSTVNEMNEKTTDIALTCSLPTSRSLFEMSTEKTNKDFFTYYCEGTNKKPGDYIYISQFPSKECKGSKKGRRKYFRGKKGVSDQESSSIMNLGDSDHFTVKCYDCNREFSCSSVRVNMERDKKSIKVSKKRNMSRAEGYGYCIILWIPIIILLVLFYFAVTATSDSSGKGDSPHETFAEPITENLRKTQPISRELYLKLSDLGF